ncbi:hypothetical protein [Methyloradius palustris]|uniref:Uncharacterized protein n=1 Tax=Methyloradius palustris TaxID=2778876 RepID=A0A8D5K009_9PROT|nr:hypothetical protein [Methyloradius palustris]BCM24283.1 hypothetical protein ZMTM_05420 [Methyloradius palustris]
MRTISTKLLSIRASLAKGFAPRLWAKNPKAFKWEIIAILLIKLIMLYGVWTLFFAHPLSKSERLENLSRVILNK